VCLASNDPALIADALLRASLSDIDPQWVEQTCLQALNRPELAVRRIALTALGHLARRYKQLDIPTVTAAVEFLRAIPELSGNVDDLCDDIDMFVPNGTDDRAL
jgi:hypothetical protein